MKNREIIIIISFSLAVIGAFIIYFFKEDIKMAGLFVALVWGIYEKYSKCVEVNAQKRVIRKMKIAMRNSNFELKKENQELERKLKVITDKNKE